MPGCTARYLREQNEAGEARRSTNALDVGVGSGVWAWGTGASWFLRRFCILWHGAVVEALSIGDMCVTLGDCSIETLKFFFPSQCWFIAFLFIPSPCFSLVENAPFLSLPLARPVRRARHAVPLLFDYSNDSYYQGAHGLNRRSKTRSSAYATCPRSHPISTPRSLTMSAFVTAGRGG